MIYTDLTKKAMRIAFDVHKDQTDKAGLPYIYHPICVAELMETEAEICVALLHDVVEDGDISFEDLKAHGFPDKIVDAVRLLTRDEDTPYMKYIERIKDSDNLIAIRVKLADLFHNRDLTRLASIDEENAPKMIERYKKATDWLMGK